MPATHWEITMYKKTEIQSYLLKTQQVITPTNTPKVGTAFIVDQTHFPVLQGITCYTLEIWEECMRLPHWHPNASELGYVVSGDLQIILWRSPGETAVFTVSAGMCWFIPQGALHSLNNIGTKPAELLVGFSSELPEDIDLPVAFNGIPAPVRSAYTSPHNILRNWQGVTHNPLVGHFDPIPELQKVITGSPYGFDFAKVTPLYDHAKLGSVIWGVKSNWSILENISLLRARLKSNTARDPIWYPDAATLYIVSRGQAEFHLILAGQKPNPFTVKAGDYIFVPAGVLHTFINLQKKEFEIIAFFSKADPQPEVSLTVATAFFPNQIRRSALTQYGLTKLNQDPLANLNDTEKSPYLLGLFGR